jgi:hypothetical protein
MCGQGAQASCPNTTRLVSLSASSNMIIRKVILLSFLQKQDISDGAYDTKLYIAFPLGPARQFATIDIH